MYVVFTCEGGAEGGAEVGGGAEAGGRVGAEGGAEAEVLGAARLRSVRDLMTAGFWGARVDSEGLLVLDMKDRKPLGLLPGLQRQDQKHQHRYLAFTPSVYNRHKSTLQVCSYVQNKQS